MAIGDGLQLFFGVGPFQRVIDIGPGLRPRVPCPVIVPEGWKVRPGIYQQRVPRKGRGFQRLDVGSDIVPAIAGVSKVVAQAQDAQPGDAGYEREAHNPSVFARHKDRQPQCHQQVEG